MAGILLLGGPPVDLWENLDGRLNAPTGTAQVPNILNGYDTGNRPPWYVAGVNYPVGVPSDATLTDWQSLSGTGISVNSGFVRVDGRTGLTLDSVDFSLHGGAWIYLVDCTNTTLTKCKFTDVNTSPGGGAVLFAGASSGLTVRYCEISQPAGTNDASTGIGANGNVTIEYCYLHNLVQHVFETAGTYNLVYRYNLIKDIGTDPSGVSHVNYTQEQINSIGTADVSFNTFYQGNMPSSGEGIQFDGEDSVDSTISIKNNTIITYGGSGDALSYMIHVGFVHSGSTWSAQNVYVQDNYYDATDAFGLLYNWPPTGGGANGTVSGEALKSGNTSLLTGVSD